MSGSGPFVVAGRGACVHGTARAGIEGVYLASACCGPVFLSGAGPGRAEVTRRAVTLVFEVNGIEVTESVVVSPDRPAVLIEWRVASPVRLHVHAHFAELRHMQGDGAMLHAGALSATIHDGAGSWRVSREGDGCRGTFMSDVVPAAPLRLVVAAAGVPAPHPASLVRAREAALDGWARDLPAFLVPPDVGDAFEWAKLRLDAAFLSGPFECVGHARSVPAQRSVAESAWCGIAAAVLGRFEDAHRAVRFIAEVATRHDAESLALELLVLARIAAAEGDAAMIADAWPRARAAYGDLIACDADGDGLVESQEEGGRRLQRGVAALGVAALRELAPVAELAGDLRAAQECATRAKLAAHAFARAAFNDVSLQTNARALLPIVLGVADHAYGRSRIERLLSARSASGLLPNDAGTGGSSLDTGLAAWAAFVIGHGAAVELLAALLAQSRTGVIGAWSDEVDAAGQPTGRWLDHPASAAMAVIAMMHGLLGFTPDAARQRATLRPRVTPAWPELDVRALCIGDARVRLSCRTAGNVQRFEVEQTAGGVPLRLVLVPELRGRLQSARVDGRAAALDARFDGVWTAPVQLDLSDARVLEVVVDEV